MMEEDKRCVGALAQVTSSNLLTTAREDSRTLPFVRRLVLISKF